VLNNRKSGVTAHCMKLYDLSGPNGANQPEVEITFPFDTGGWSGREGGEVTVVPVANSIILRWEEWLHKISLTGL